MNILLVIVFLCKINIFWFRTGFIKRGHHFQLTTEEIKISEVSSSAVTDDAVYYSQLKTTEISTLYIDFSIKIYLFSL